MTINIEEFIDLISHHNIEHIEREIRTTAFDIRQSTSENISTLENKRRLFELARQFILQHKNIAINWTSITHATEKVAQWFYDLPAETFPFAKTLAAFTWKYALEKKISSDISYLDIIFLGTIYLDEPYKLSGFLVWLLEKSVSENDIIRSGILHQYFKYAVFDIDQIHQFYEILKSIPSANKLLDLIRTVSCAVPAFLNHKGNETNPYQSYNLTGDTFFHTEEHSSEVVFNNNAAALLSEKMIDCSVTLAELFGWTYIKLLDFNSPAFKLIFQKLLGADFDCLTKALPQEILSGGFSADVIEIMLERIVNYIDEPNADYFYSLLQKDSFYIQLIPYFKDIIDLFSPQFIHDSIQTIFYCPFLCELCEFFEPFSQYSATVDLLKTTIFENFLSYSALMPDEIFDAVSDLTGIDQLCKERLALYEKNMASLVNQLAIDEINFDALMHQWGSYLGHVGLFSEILTEIKKESSFPFSLYAVRACVIEKYWKKSSTENTEFNLDQIMQSILSVHSTEDKKRTLLEALLFVKDKNLIIRLLNELAAKKSLNLFVHASFGEDKSLIDCAIEEHRNTLLSLIFHKTKITGELLNYYIKDAYKAKNFDALSEICKTQSQSISKKMSRKMLEYACVSKRWDLFQTVAEINDQPKHVATVFGELFVSAALTGQKDTLITLSQFTSVKPSNNDISNAIQSAASKKEYETIFLLCGFKGDLYQRSPSITKNNVSQYFSAFFKIRKNFCSARELREFLFIKTEDNENLLHLLAKNNNHIMLRDYFSILKDYFNPSELAQMLSHKNNAGEIPAATKKNREGRRIDLFLNQGRREYDVLSRNTTLKRPRSPVFFSTPDPDDLILLKGSPTTQDAAPTPAFFSPARRRGTLFVDSSDDETPNMSNAAVAH